MTDQKQAPEQDSVKWWIENRAPVDVAEAFEALTKQRDELKTSFNDLVVIACSKTARALKAEAERDQALAASAAREIAMRDRAAEMVKEHLGPNPYCQADILALPLSPDGQQALDDLLTNAWEGGYYHQGPYTDNPHRKK